MSARVQAALINLKPGVPQLRFEGLKPIQMSSAIPVRESPVDEDDAQLSRVCQVGGTRVDSAISPGVSSLTINPLNYCLSD